MIRATRRAIVTGVGAYLPDDVVTNDDLASIMDTDDAWISSRSGIRVRRRAAANQTTADLGYEASRAALAAAGRTIDETDLLIVATTTPDLTMPSTAALIRSRFGGAGDHGAVFDIQAVCAGFVYGLSVASAMIECGRADRVLLVGAETMTRLLDMTDRTTAVLFGDGAGAAVLEAGERTPDAPQILGHRLHANAALSSLLRTDGGPSVSARCGRLQMKGSDVYRHAVDKGVAVVRDLLADTGYEVSDVDWFVPHQSNRRIIEASARKIGIAPEKVVVTVDRHANTSAASVPLALTEAVADGRIRSGHLVVLEAVGGGLTWGASLIRWD